MKAWEWWGAGCGWFPELCCSVSRREEGRCAGQATQTKSNKTKQAPPQHTQVSTLHFKVFLRSTFTEFVILKWCPAKSIPRFTTFYSVTIYVFAIIFQNLFSFSVSHTLQWKPRQKESKFLAVGHPIKYVLIYALDCKYLLARKIIKLVALIIREKNHV